MSYLQNIINRVKNTFTRIRSYLTQPVHNSAGEVVGNRITMVCRDIQANIMHKCYYFCINKVSTMIILYIVSVSAAVGVAL